MAAQGDQLHTTKMRGTCEMKDISVIVPVYNGESMLDACIRSIQKAGSRVKGIILVDDGSTDETLQRAKALAETDARIRVIHTDNHGCYEARRTGIAAAACPYLAFADVDDRFCEGALDRLAELLEAYDADISFGGIIKTDNPDSPIPPATCAEVRELTPEQIWPRLMRWGTQEFILYVWHKLYRRELMENLLEADGICQGEDVLLSCQAFIKAKRIVETTAPVYLYYQNPESMLHKSFGDRDLDLIRVWDYVVNLMPDDKLRYMAQINRWRTDFTLICRLILANNRGLEKRFATDLEKWRKSMRQHYREILKAKNMPVNRRLLLTGLCFAYAPTKVFMQLASQSIKIRNNHAMEIRR